MANIFENTDLVAMDAAIILKDEIVAPELVGGSVEGTFDGGVGDTIEVKVPPVETANRHDGTGPFQVDDVVEETVLIPILDQPYKKVKLTQRQMQFDVTDFTEIITRPNVIAIAEEVNKMFIEQLAKGFAENLSGTPGSRADSFKDLINAHIQLFDQRSPRVGLNAIIDGTTYGSLLDLSQFQNQDFGPERSAGVRQGMLDLTHNTEFHPSQAVSTIDRGDIAGTVLTDGVPTEGAAFIHMDAFTAGTGTVLRGARFTVAGDSQEYTVNVDSPLVGNEGDIFVTPNVTAATEAAGDGVLVTFEAAAHENMIFHPNAAAKAIIAPTPLVGLNSSVAIEDGISVRVTFESTTDGDNGAQTTVLFDIFIACEVIRPFAGLLFGDSTP